MVVDQRGSRSGRPQRFPRRSRKPIAIKAFQEGTLPFPDDTFIARLAWKYVPSVQNNAVFGREQSFVTGAPTNLEFMVKDSKKYATAGGWGFGQFTNGKPDDEAVHSTCFSCHQPAKPHRLTMRCGG